MQAATIEFCGMFISFPCMTCGYVAEAETQAETSSLMLYHVFQHVRDSIQASMRRAN